MTGVKIGVGLEALPVEGVVDGTMELRAGSGVMMPGPEAALQ